MQRSDFAYHLPPELIAQSPPAERSGARLLVLGAQGAITDARVVDLADWLSPGDLLVLNDTRVIPARLLGRKTSGGAVEVLIERILNGHPASEALALVRASKSPQPGSELLLGTDSRVEVLGREAEFFHLRLRGGDWFTLCEAAGHMPLPPYIRRADGLEDRRRYQTLYAEKPGAVAAPTAGLHFDEALFARLATRGVRRATVTLHVGAGTFQPVRVDDLAAHRMHAERFEVPAATVDAIAETRAAGGRIVAVGTTVVRSLEAAAAQGGGRLLPCRGETRLFITPGYRFHVVDRLLTNFHLPESTLLMLVSAFAGHAPVMAAYRHAVAQRYRFFSYGDAMLLSRQDGG